MMLGRCISELRHSGIIHGCAFHPGILFPCRYRKGHINAPKKRVQLKKFIMEFSQRKRFETS